MRMMNVLSAAFVAATAQLFGQAGDPDPTFRTTMNGAVWAIGLQENGKIVFGGGFSEVNGAARNGIARLNSDGSLDLTFNPGTGADGTILNIAIQPDGKILAGGLFGSLNGSGAGLARLNPDGSRDTSFTSQGFPVAYGLAYHPSGNIYFANYNDVRRLNSDGTPDNTFVMDIADEGFGGFHSYVTTFLVQPDGRMLMGGNFFEVNGQLCYRMVRLNVDGTLDNTFFADAFGSQLEVNAMGLRSDGKIYAAGWTLRRLEPNGAYDNGFPYLQFFTVFDCLAVQEDGKPLVGGNFHDVQGRQLLARFNDDAAIDENFSGYVDGQVEAILVQPDGRILIGGGFGNVNGVAHAGIARLLGDKPVLNTQHRSNNTIINSWPAAYTNWVLQETKHLKHDKWKTVRTRPVTLNGINYVTEVIHGKGNAGKSYRLAKP